MKCHQHDSIWYSALAAQVPLASATTHPPCPLAGSLPCVAAASWAGCLPACREATGSPEGWSSHSLRIRPQSLNPLAGTGQNICLGRSPLASPQRILPDSDQPPQPPSRADEGDSSGSACFYQAISLCSSIIRDTGSTSLTGPS